MTMIEISGGTRTVQMTPEELARQAANLGADTVIRDGLTEIVRDAIMDGGPAVPSLAAFEIDDPKRTAEEDPEYHDFLDAPDLERVALRLIGQHETLGFLTRHGARIEYAWKREGGKSQGKSRYGYCQKLSGYAKHVTGADFLIWLAADHCRLAPPGAVEKLVFHELLHCGLSDSGGWAIVGHDFEGWLAELRVYGAWQHELERARDAFAATAQLPLAGL